jgi:hypothetical protein
MTGTSILQVDFGLSKYLANDRPVQLYPGIIWDFNTSKFSKDFRTSTVQVIKTYTSAVIITMPFDVNIETEDQKLAKWDLCEGYFATYINKMNETDKVQIINIEDLKGQYIPEGVWESRKEIGILFDGVQIKTWCNG